MSAVASNRAMPTSTADRASYPWDSLKKIGDNFFYPDSEQHARQTKICSAAIQHGKRVGREYRTQVGDKDGVPGVFVWLKAFTSA